MRVGLLTTVVLLATVMAPGARLAAADSACLAEPEHEATPGEHWYYHFDQQRNRKCWHLGDAPATFFQPPASRRSERASFSLNSAFAPFLRQMRNAFRQPEPHEHPAGEPRIVQSDATKLLTIDDITRQPEFQFPEERAETRPSLFLNAEQRRALYDEYVKWEALQRDAVRSPAP
jgi:hypothetical protein